MLVIDSGSRDRSREIARAAGATVIEIPAGGVRARPHTQPRPGPDERRARGLPDPGRHTRTRGLAAAARGQLPDGRARGRLVRAPPATPGREPDRQAAVARLLPRLLPERRARGPPPRRRHLPHQQQLLRGTRGVGADPVPGDPLRGGPGARGRPAGRRLDEGLQPVRRRGPLARLRPRRVLPALLRRVPRAARRSGPAHARVAGRGGGHAAPVGGRRPRVPAGDRALARSSAPAGRPRAWCITADGSSSAASASAPTSSGGRCAGCCRSIGAATGSPTAWSRRDRRSTRTLCACSPTAIVPLSPPSPFDDARESLELAWVVPPYGIGSGGQAAIFRIMRVLESRGHRCSLWVHDPKGIEPHSSASLRRRMKLHYTAPDSPVELGFEHWTGCDVAIATGWETVYPVLRLPRCRARAYFVQDHEPEFFATSVGVGARRAHLPLRASVHRLEPVAGRGDRGALRSRGHEPSSTASRRTEYFPVPDVPRRGDTVLFYARDHTPRRAVELGLLALQILLERRPHLRVVMYGTHRRIKAPFAFEQLGMEGPERLQEALLRVHRRPQPLAHQPLPDRRRDARLRPAGGRARGPRLRGASTEPTDR